MLVKRLVCIEDLGDIDVLLTDKTGTLTEGRISFTRRARPGRHARATEVLLLGLLATEAAADRRRRGRRQPARRRAVGGAAAPRRDRPRVPRGSALLPFDHDRRMTSVARRRRPDGAALLVVKGAPEAVLARCRDVPDEPRSARCDAQFAAGQPGRRRRQPGPDAD